LIYVGLPDYPSLFSFLQIYFIFLKG